MGYRYRSVHSSQIRVVYPKYLVVSSNMYTFAVSKRIKKLKYSILIVDGILAVCFMQHNPCAWVIFVLSILLLVVPKYK